MGVISAYKLFSQNRTHGSFHSAAIFNDSWNVPWLVAPSPKNVRATRPFFARRAPSAAPTAVGIPPATIPLQPRLPTVRSVSNIEPLRPRQHPVSRPNNSDMTAFTEVPLARVAP